MAVVNEILVGVDSETGLSIHRRFATFKPNVYIKEDSTVSLESNIEVYYNEYYKKTDGSIFLDTFKKKHYIVANIPAVLWNEEDELPEGVNIGDEKTPAWNAFDNWFTSLARTPVNPNTYGILDAIEMTLQGLPIGIQNGYVLQQSL